jgi:hypothetical protein
MSPKARLLRFILVWALTVLCLGIPVTSRLLNTSTFSVLELLEHTKQSFTKAYEVEGGH